MGAKGSVEAAKMNDNWGHLEVGLNGFVCKCEIMFFKIKIGKQKQKSQKYLCLSALYF